MVLGLASSGVWAVMGELAVAPFLAAMAVPVESLDPALDYLRFAVAASLPIGMYNIYAGALPGLGDGL